MDALRLRPNRMITSGERIPMLAVRGFVKLAVTYMHGEIPRSGSLGDGVKGQGRRYVLSPGRAKAGELQHFQGWPIESKC